MTNIDELVEIINNLGGSASIEEIAKVYQKKHHMVILPEHKAVMINILQENPKVVSFIETVSKWESITKTLLVGRHTSELSQVVTATLFEKAYQYFIEQADKNAISKKAHGSKVPFGFSEKPFCDGAHFKPQYGQGAASVAPYMNWWVVSIYYLPQNGNIVLGIEEDRYPHILDISIKPIRYAQIGNKKVKIAVFYSTTKNAVNYTELYDIFIRLCEEVIRLGLN